MKHEVTSYNTKKLLADSLKKKMAAKAFSKITVSEVIADCGVNRKTFYYHFEDIYALLKWMFEQETVAVVKHFDLVSDYKEAIRFVMDYVEENDYIVRCAYDSIGRDGMMQFFSADFMGVIGSVIQTVEEQKGAKIDPDFKIYLTRFYTEALAGMLIDWVKEKDKRDKEKTLAYLGKILDVAMETLVQRTK